MIGETLKQFRILAKLGEGGMGVVYRAMDETLRREVALKVLPSSVAGDEERRRRFLREARSAAAVTHPNIATIYEIGEADGNVFIAMELIVGQTLRDRMEPGLVRGEALRIAKEIARGLARAHDKGVVHRDLKPENVMVTDEGDVKILDFGLAKLRETDSGEASATAATQMTVEGRIMGTPGYMSPEQAEGRLEIDARSDVFSFGAMLYEMLSGVRPFRGATNIAVLYGVLHQEPEPLEARCPDLPPELLALVARCLRKAPAERFASAREVAQALGGEVSLHSADAMSRRAPAAEKLSTVTGADTALGATIASDTAHLGPPAPLAPASPKRAPRTGLWVGVTLATLAAAFGAVAIFVRHERPHPTAVAGAASVTSATPAVKAAVAMTEHPLPRTSNPEAAMRYASALRRIRVGGLGVYADLSRAVTLDSTLAAAQLRLALYAPMFGAGPASERHAHWTAATSLSSSLEPRDRALLPVAEAMAVDPFDFATAITRTHTAIDQGGDDPELELLLFLYEERAGLKKEAAATARHLLELDPLSTQVLSQQAMVARQNDQTDEARSLATHCIEVSPASSGCHFTQAQLDAEAGRCDALLADARTLVTLEPEDARPYSLLAEALDATGARAEAVKSALDQAEARRVEGAGPAGKEATGLASLVLALRTGDFAAADTLALGLGPAFAMSSSERDHAELAALRIAIAEETGSATKALEIATAFARQSKGWTQNAPLEVRTKRLYLEHEAGILKDAEFVASRERRFEGAFRQRGGMSPNQQERLKLLVDAEYAETPAEAKAALPTDAPLSLQPGDLHDHALDFGRLLFLAGRVDEAVPILEKETHRCQTIPGALTLDLTHMTATLNHMHAQLLLGEALEARGDKGGACHAYGVVQSRWKEAKPRSVTLEKAKERAHALGCAAPASSAH